MRNGDFPHGRGPVLNAQPFETGRFLLQCSAVMAMAGMVLLFLMIVAFALPVFAESGTGGPFSWVWAPGQGRYLRVVGVGIVVSPGSLQREHTGGPRFVHEAGPRAAPPAGGAWCFLCWGPGWPGTKGSEGLL